MIRRGVSDQTPKDPIRRIGAKVKETKVGTMVPTTERVNMSDVGTITTTLTLTKITLLCPYVILVRA